MARLFSTSREVEIKMIQVIEGEKKPIFALEARIVPEMFINFYINLMIKYFRWFAVCSLGHIWEGVCLCVYYEGGKNYVNEKRRMLLLGTRRIILFFNADFPPF